MQKLVINPINDKVAQKMTENRKLRPVASKRNALKKVPKIMAKKVKEVIIPLAKEIFSVLTNSGRIPYFEGPKTALCVAKKKRDAQAPIRLSNANAAIAPIMMSNSNNFVKTMIFRLLKRSAKIPEEAENRRKGRTKIAPERERIQ